MFWCNDSVDSKNTQDLSKQKQGVQSHFNPTNKNVEPVSVLSPCETNCARSQLHQLLFPDKIMQFNRVVVAAVQL